MTWSGDPAAEWIEKITREETPAGLVICREFFDRHGKLMRRDVEHLISIILTTEARAVLKSEDK